MAVNLTLRRDSDYRDTPIPMAAPKYYDVTIRGLPAYEAESVRWIIEHLLDREGWDFTAIEVTPR